MARDQQRGKVVPPATGFQSSVPTSQPNAEPAPPAFSRPEPPPRKGSIFGILFALVFGFVCVLGLVAMALGMIRTLRGEDGKTGIQFGAVLIVIGAGTIALRDLMAPRRTDETPDVGPALAGLQQGLLGLQKNLDAIQAEVSILREKPPVAMRPPARDEPFATERERGRISQPPPPPSPDPAILQLGTMVDTVNRSLGDCTEQAQNLRGQMEVVLRASQPVAQSLAGIDARLRAIGESLGALQQALDRSAASAGAAAQRSDALAARIDGAAPRLEALITSMNNYTTEIDREVGEMMEAAVPRYEPQLRAAFETMLQRLSDGDQQDQAIRQWLEGVIARGFAGYFTPPALAQLPSGAPEASPDAPAAVDEARRRATALARGLRFFAARLTDSPAGKMASEEFVRLAREVQERIDLADLQAPDRQWGGGPAKPWSADLIAVYSDISRRLQTDVLETDALARRYLPASLAEEVTRPLAAALGFTLTAPREGDPNLPSEYEPVMGSTGPQVLRVLRSGLAESGRVIARPQIEAGNRA